MCLVLYIFYRLFVLYNINPILNNPSIITKAVIALIISDAKLFEKQEINNRIRDNVIIMNMFNFFFLKLTLFNNV